MQLSHLQLLGLCSVGMPSGQGRSARRCISAGSCLGSAWEAHGRLLSMLSMLSGQVHPTAAAPCSATTPQTPLRPAGQRQVPGQNAAGPRVRVRAARTEGGNNWSTPDGCLHAERRSWRRWQRPGSPVEPASRSCRRCTDAAVTRGNRLQRCAQNAGKRRWDSSTCHPPS
jgi:hypothetical protein